MTTYKSFAVIGTGNIGQPMIKALSEYPDSSVVVLLRKGSASKSLPQGVKSATVDFKDNAAITAALREHNVEVLVSAVGSLGLEGQKGFADAAKAAGVKLFVPSEYGVPTEGETDGLLAIKASVVEHAKSIGLPYARYYNGYFADFVQWLFAVDDSTKKFFVVGKGDKPASFTSVADAVGFVAYTVNKLPPSKLENATFRVEGTRATFNEVGALFKYPVVHVEALPSEIPLADIKTYLQSKGDEGAGSTSWDTKTGKDGTEKADSSNHLWQGHKWDSLKDVLGL